jgi:cell division septation protein DedD
MSFCASCGRQRNGTARFCGGCGAEFSDSLAGSGDQESPAAPAPHDPPRDAARMDAIPDLTRVEPPTVPPDTFASWYQQPPGVSNEADSTLQPTQTVNAARPQPPGHPTYGFTPGNPFSSANPVMPPAPPFSPGSPAGPPNRGGKRGLFIVLAVIVVLAAGGGAYALATTLGKHSTAQPPAQPTVGTSTHAAGSPPAGATQQASAPATSAAASPAPSPTLSLVAISPGVTASAARPQVETLLSHYFHGINSHSYAEYASTLNPQEQAKQTQSEFTSGYSSTTDSGMTLTGLSDGGNGGLTATVTFTSRQSAAQSVDHSACNAWTLNLYLVPQGAGYLIGTAPSGYQPTYSDC